MHPISHCPTASKIWSRFVSLALALLVVTSCQTDPEKPQGRQTYTADLPAIPDTLMPQRGVIKAKSDTATATFTVLPASIKIDLDAPPAETIKVDLWRAGVKMYELDYVHSGSQKLVYTRSKRENSLAVTLMRRIYPASDSATFAAEFAKLLVDNDPLVLSLGFPAKSIDGLDTALVMRKAMEVVAAKQLPVSSVIPKEGIWALGLDSAGVHERIRALVRSGDIEVDTAKLFPPYPMRTKNGIALEAQLVAGGPAVGITGAFEATYKIVNLSSRVLRDGQENRDFEIPTLVFSEYPKLLELSGKLSIRAKESAAAGNYTLEITAQDDSLRKAVSTVDFQVVPAADKQGPRIEIVAPSANTVLENVVDKIDVKADVSDPSGVDSVWIDNRVASLVDGKWVVQGVFIPVTNLGYKVVVRAKDSKGNISNADIVVGRMAPLDPGAPITSVVQPKETEFPFDSASVMVRWKIEDPRAEVTKVWIGGKEAVKEDGFVWACRVNLPPTGTPTTITFLGINAKNDSTQKFVQLTRKTDAKGPEIEILSPIDGAGVGYEIQSIVVRAKVSDPSGLDSVKINGMKAEEASQEYLRSLNLEPGQSTEIVVEAWDKLSNASRTSIRVSRKGPPDSSAPRITLLEPKDAGVVLPLSSTTTTVKWIVADLFGIADTGVKIAGRQADRSKDTFSLVVAVPAPGKELSYRIDAVNAKGIRNFETVTLKRATDSDAPSVVRVDSGRTVEFEIDSAVASWKVSDNYKMGVVQINGKEIAGSNGLYSVKIGLVFGGNPVILSAKDSIGNSRVDSINVIRTWKDTSKPSILREAGTDTKNVGFEVGEVSVGWKVTDNGVVTVKINGIKTEPNASGIYGATIVLVDATTGVKIEAVDAAGNSKSDSITITKASDATDPLVVRQSDTKDTTVPYGIATYTVAWKVTDNGGIKTVEIGGKSPSKTGDIYSYQVALSKPGKHVVKIWALDNAGNDFVDSVTIVRAYHDSIAPVVTPADTATRTKTVSYSTAKVVLSWKVTDNDAIYTVAIGGSVVQGSAGIYSRTIDLVVGPNAVLVVAKDTAGNSDSETVVITRATRDSVAPTITPRAGATNREIVYDSTATKLNWTVTDVEGVKEVSVNGAILSPVSGSEYTYSAMNLKVGANKFTIVAKDAENQSSLTVTITRAWKDTVAPIITRGAGTGPREVTFDSSMISMSWNVVDTLLSEVKIQDAITTGTLNTFTRNVSLAVGANLVKIVAKDASGNAKMDTFTIVRKMGLSPVLTISHAQGVYDSVIHVRVTSSVAEATIRYTTDGTEPNEFSMIYSSPVLIDQGRTFKVNAVASGRTPSVTSVRVYSLRAPVPTASLKDGFETDSNFFVSLSSGTGMSIFYTTNGEDPTPYSAKYFGPIEIDSIRTIKMIATKPGWVNSPVASVSLRANVPVKILAVSGGATFLIRADHSLWSTGSGFLGDGVSGARETFVKIRQNVKDVSSSQILMENGDLYSFGSNGSGQIGDGTSGGDPVLVPKLIRSGVKAISGKDGVALFVDSDGNMYATGNNYLGQLCNESLVDSYSPTLVQNSVASVETGSGRSFFVTTAGDLYGCGSGPLGDGDRDNYRSAKVSLISEGVASAYLPPDSRTSNRAYAIKKDGTLLHADGYRDSLFTPLLANVKAVALGGWNDLFLTNDGRVLAYGYNQGNFGFGTLYEDVNPPKEMANNVKAIGNNGNTSYIVKLDGTLWAIGYNGGSFGNGTTADSDHFVRIRF